MPSVAAAAASPLGIGFIMSLSTRDRSSYDNVFPSSSVATAVSARCSAVFDATSTGTSYPPLSTGRWIDYPTPRVSLLKAGCIVEGGLEANEPPAVEYVVF